jgi:polyhydroxyalkanoate synthesis regulator phasin
MKKRLVSICSIAVILAISIAMFATGVLASEATSTENGNGSEPKLEQRRNRLSSTEHLKNMLDTLVADGAITQTEADEAYALATADDATKADFSKLPQAVKDALQAKMPQKSGAGQKLNFDSAQRLKNLLSCLVSDGTITQEAADEAYALATADDASKADFSKLPQAVKDALKAKMPQKGEGQHFNVDKTAKQQKNKTAS